METKILNDNDKILKHLILIWYDKRNVLVLKGNFDS